MVKAEEPLKMITTTTSSQQVDEEETPTSKRVELRLSNTTITFDLDNWLEALKRSDTQPYRSLLMKR